MISLLDLEAILENYEDPQGYTNGWWFWEDLPEDESVEIPTIGSVSIIDSYYGEEGDWNSAVYIIFRIEWEDGDVVYYRKTGHYRSFDGTTWYGGLEVVKPVKKYVTVFE